MIGSYLAGFYPLDQLANMFSHDYVRQAFIAGTGAALAAGLIGYFVVLRNQVFASDAIGHLAFTGALGSRLLGIDPTLGLFASTIFGSLGIGALGGRAKSRDVVIGTAFAWILGLGSLFLSIYTTVGNSLSGAVGVNVLFGSIYGVSSGQALLTLGLGIAVAAAVLAMARPLLFASVDADVAAARGLPVSLIGLMFLALLGITVAAAVPAVGALLVFGLMATPAAAAQRLSARPFRALAIAAALALTSVWLGLLLSYFIPQLPPSFAIIAVAFSSYCLSFIRVGTRRRN